MADSKEVVITYETLFELLRIEKQRPELQKLETSFYGDVVLYLKEKERYLTEPAEQTSLFSSNDQDRTRLELENIKRILKELYNRREKKMVEMAINKVRTGASMVSTSTMMSLEKDLYETLTENLGHFRQNILLNLINGRLPEGSTITKDRTSFAEKLPETASEIGSEASAESSPANSRDSQEETQENRQEEYQEENSEPQEAQGVKSPVEEQRTNLFRKETTPEPIKSTTDALGDNHKIRFLMPVGEVVGPDLQIYGPFEPGSVAELPSILAQALLSKSQAESVD